MAVPYENVRRRASRMRKTTPKFGCTNYGVMTDWERGVILVQFTWKARRVSQ